MYIKTWVSVAKDEHENTRRKYNTWKEVRCFAYVELELHKYWTWVKNKLFDKLVLLITFELEGAFKKKKNLNCYLE